MPTTDDFSPDWVSPPGETVLDVLEERGYTLTKLAAELRWKDSDTEAFIVGDRRISLSLARGLQDFLGGSADFWLQRDKQYQRDTLRISLQANSASWVRNLPIRDMAAYGWIPTASRREDYSNVCLQFFDVETPLEWFDRYAAGAQQAAFRTSPAFVSSVGALASWLREGERRAAMLPCASWDAEALRASLPTIRTLSRLKDPARFVPRLTKLCAECGVAFAVVRSPAGCRASGVARFVNEGRALVQLSARYLSDDHFWFSFFHEVGHLLLHADEGMLIEFPTMASSSMEDEANQFSADVLVPPDYRELLTTVKLQRLEIAQLARKLKVSSGVIVGQLQHMGRLHPSHMNDLKNRYRWAE